MRTQAQKADAFRALHARPKAFIIPNPWDAGTARMLAKLGFEALATTSAGFAFTLGRPDGKHQRKQRGEHERDALDTQPGAFGELTRRGLVELLGRCHPEARADAVAVERADEPRTLERQPDHRLERAVERRIVGGVL